MNQESLNSFQAVVHELFIRWDALKLAVEHMGGRSGQQVKRFYFNVYTIFVFVFFYQENFPMNLN